MAWCQQGYPNSQEDPILCAPRAVTAGWPSPGSAGGTPEGNQERCPVLPAEQGAYCLWRGRIQRVVPGSMLWDRAGLLRDVRGSAPLFSCSHEMHHALQAIVTEHTCKEKTITYSAECKEDPYILSIRTTAYWNRMENGLKIHWDSPLLAFHYEHLCISPCPVPRRASHFPSNVVCLRNLVLKQKQTNFKYCWVEGESIQI